MASKKTKVTEEVVAPEVVVAAVENEAAVAQESTEIPAYVDQVLKLYPHYKELYITPRGGAFASEPPKSFQAILFQNPYFKY